jgi:hypothetical protein
MPKFKSQGEKIKAFTLIIPGIVNQMVKISAGPKTCDKSDYVASTPNPLKVLQYLVRSMDIEIQRNNKGL